MRLHASYFKLFLSVAPTRRKTTRSQLVQPSEEQVDRAFTEHVNRMAKSGVYGDNLEIVAFARCYGVNVKIYQRDFAYQISCDDGEDNGSNTGTSSGEKQLLHIAYHSWEHYSSVRNIDGPHNGLPQVSPKEPSPDDKQRQKGLLEKEVSIQPWMEKVVTQSLPAALPIEKIREMLAKCHCDIGMTVSRLLEELSENEEEDNTEKKSEDTADAAGEAVNGTINNDNDKVVIEEAAGKAKKPAPVAKRGRGRPPKTDKSQQAKTEHAADDRPAKQPSTRPKRETARERKDRQQREKMERKKGKASGSAKAAAEDSKDKAEPSAVSDGIKTLHV
ncbi:hypothetical protein ABW21_db0208599 [Orbilia brochopaga]|nr:hypothetical protein ABW21_db0208599 [Drechslerella brochopaga]